MSYTTIFAFNTMPSQTVYAQLVDTSFVNSGSEITTGVTEVGNNGHYGYVATLADDFEGFVKFYPSGDATDVLAFFAITPREISPINAVIESGAAANSQTWLEQWRIAISALAGKSNSNASTGWASRDLADSKDRIASTLDDDGMRTATTLDGS